MAPRCANWWYSAICCHYYNKDMAILLVCTETTALEPSHSGLSKQRRSSKKSVGFFKKISSELQLKLTKKVVQYMDVTMDLSTRLYRPYMKPNNTLQYINVKSNHPPAILKIIPEGVNKRLSEISSNKEVFDQAAPPYQKALDESEPYENGS